MNNQSECSDKSNRKYHDYVEALEEERRKVQVFQRELPLCFELVTQAIETWKQRLTGTTTTDENNLSECSSPILEEFIPIHRADSSDHSVHEEQEQEPNNPIDRNPKKSDWLRSVQLWNQTPDPPPPSPKQDSPRKSSALEVKSNGRGGAFHPFKKGESVGDGDTPATAPPSTSSTAGTGGGGSKKEEKEGRKNRRCWSAELHKRFLGALQQLGGSHVATPKQIRELMKVDGLTNDEVKSHLQKYRLHTRRPSSSSHNNNNNNTQTPQFVVVFVVVGGIWVPPEYHATNKSDSAGGGPSLNGIYAPVATLPRPFGDIEGGDQSYSPVSSTSTHKTNV